MMDRGRVIFDASAYMLFEASGDSEVERLDGTITTEFELESDGGAEDDAQSCSYGSLSDSGRVHDIDADGDGDGADRFHNYCADFVRVGEYSSGDEDHEDDDYVDNNEEDGVVDQCCRRYVVAPPVSTIAEAKKSNGCEDSQVKLLNERERDRLFWENCLAS